MSKLKNTLLAWTKGKSELEEVIQSGDESIILSRDTGPAVRMALFVIFVAFGGFILWAIFAPLDEGATTSGNVVVESHRRVIQHMNGGVVEKILVKEGQPVDEGTVLVRLVQTNVKSQMLIYEHQYQQYSAQVKSLKELVDEGYYPLINYREIVRQRDEAQLKFQTAKEELDRTEIRSPIKGTVMGLNITMGGVVSPGVKVLEVVPADEGLVVEAKISTQLIDRIHPGLEAQVRFSALNQRTTPIVYGKVEWISADKFQITDAMTARQVMGDGYYTAKIRLDPEELKKLGEQQLYPGMPADVIIQTGRRNFMSYLLKPFTDRAALSLKER